MHVWGPVCASDKEGLDFWPLARHALLSGTGPQEFGPATRSRAAWACSRAALALASFDPRLSRLLVVVGAKGSGTWGSVSSTVGVRRGDFSRGIDVVVVDRSCHCVTVPLGP